MNQPVSRRKFLRNSSLAASAFWIGSSAFVRGNSPNNKHNIAVIVVANLCGSNLRGVEGENIVALCDMDDNYLRSAAQKFPQAKKFNDFRKVLDEKNIDAVVISTADHTHAVATVGALQTGRHVYCEKPLTHTVREARIVRQAAAKNKKLATQMGIQIHAGANYRRVVELVQSGAIGTVSECHVWKKGNTPVVPAAGSMLVPRHVHWDLWLGPAQERDFHSAYHPRNWRGHWAFGGGTLGDFGCHYMDLPFWALNLRAPSTIEAEGPEPHPELTPDWTIVHYGFAKRGAQPAVNMTWYDGGKRPQLLSETLATEWESGVLFVGNKGMLIADYSKHRLLPESRFQNFTPPKRTIADSIGHHAEWIQACKTGSPTT